MGTDIVSWVIIICCIMMSAYFSATETAFSSLNRIRMKNMAEKGSKRAKLVLKLSENYDSLLSTILIGNNIVNITCTSLVTILCVKGFGEDVGATLSTVITTVVILVFGEVSPKSIAKESAETVAMLSAPLLRISTYCHRRISYSASGKSCCLAFLKVRIIRGLQKKNCLQLYRKLKRTAALIKRKEA